jgi:hypothetical protein
VNKVFKNIAIFSLWFAGLVILAHLFIPHDHHPDCYVSGNQEACHAGNAGHPINSHGFPLHCHALNELTIEKTATVLFVPCNIPTCNLFFLSFAESIVPEIPCPGVRIKDLHKPVADSDYQRLSSFRAPPSLI